MSPDIDRRLYILSFIFFLLSFLLLLLHYGAEKTSGRRDLIDLVLLVCVLSSRIHQKNYETEETTILIPTKK